MSAPPPVGAAAPAHSRRFFRRVFRWWPAAPSGAPAATHAHVPAELLELAGLDATQVLERLGATPAGLSPGRVAARLQQFGLNQIAHEGERSVLVELLERFANPLNVLLLLLAGVSMVVGDREAALIIFAMVILSVSLAFFQERRPSQAAARLRALVHTTAAVRRRMTEDGPPAAGPGPDEAELPWTELPIHLLVPGDIVHLSAGDLVPADVRLLSAKDLYLSQATLTGEALPAEKSADPIPAAAPDVLQLHNVCFMGTSVVSGAAQGVVVLTGSRACFGGLANLIAGQRAMTEFDKGVSRFAWLMIRFILVMAPLVFLINGITKGDWVEALLFAVAVAVGLTPEMLPMIVTVNLGKGALPMSRRKVIVRRLNAIQNFGAMDVLCTDKTGTLTQDRIILEKHVDLLGNDSDDVLLYAYLNSRHQSGLKNLLDVAILQHPECERLGAVAREYHKFDEVPFDFSRRRMSVAVATGSRRLLICKGAVEEVFAVSDHGLAAGERFDLDASHLKALRATSAALNEDGFRVIAIAYRELPAGQQVCSVRDESGLTLLGYVAFLDPPKERARAALGDRQHRPLHAVHRADQLAVRLRDLLHDVLHLQGDHAGAGIAVPDRLVRRVAAVADTDHSHHPHAPSAVLRKPRQRAADPHERGHLRGRTVAAAVAFRRATRLHAAAGPLLATPRGDARDLSRADPRHEDVVSPPLRLELARLSARA